MRFWDASFALERLRPLSAAWHEVLRFEAVRSAAQPLLRAHPLWAADSRQLAAAVVASDRDASSLLFVCLDDRLNDAATREGFPILRV